MTCILVASVVSAAFHTQSTAPGYSLEEQREKFVYAQYRTLQNYIASKAAPGQSKVALDFMKWVKMADVDKSKLLAEIQSASKVLPDMNNIVYHPSFTPAEIWVPASWFSKSKGVGVFNATDQWQVSAKGPFGLYLVKHGQSIP